MKNLLLAFALATPFFCARAEEVIPAELFFDPPEDYLTIGPTPENTSFLRKYVDPESTPENHREISIGFAPPEDFGGPEVSRNITALGKKLGEKLATLRTRELSAVSETTLGGRPAVHASYRMSIPDYPLMPSMGMHVYWIPASQDRVIQILLATTPADKLPELRATLKSIRFQDPVKAALPVTKGKVSLGDERATIHSACGKPPTSTPTFDVYQMDPYVVMLKYSMPRLESIQYFRSNNPKGLVTSMGGQEWGIVAALTVPLQPDDVKAILSRHSTAPDTWKPVGENRWERADGAVAFHWVKKNSIILATKEAWPKFNLPE